MFGFSLQKLIFTVLAIVAVWQAFKWIGRMQANRAAAARAERGRRPASAAAPGSRRSAPIDDGVVEDMVKCAVCGDYVSKGAASNCGRPGCPYPG